MHICLTSISYPPEGTGGIPRQRQILAQALTRQGHEVHLITQGKKLGTILQDRIHIHTIPIRTPSLTFSEKFHSINASLTHSLGILEQVRVIRRETHLDILDVPLWGLEGLVPLYANDIPSVLWLQTSRTHLVELEGRSPKGDEAGIMLLEKECIQRAQGIIADSHTVIPDFEKLFGICDLKERSRAIPLGIPDLPENLCTPHPGGEMIEVLLVGRLEKRKGTPLLLEIIPELLKSEKRLQLRFIGEDNSHWDGFHDQTKQTYPEYFYRRWPGLRNRVIFEGSVPEKRLIEAYSQADIMLVPSLYESFGLIYLEAMRAGLPVITFALGAASEIYPEAEADGALLIPCGNDKGLLSAIHDLSSNPKRRVEMGLRGRQRFLDSYQDTRMAEETANYYREIQEAWRGPGPGKPRRIFQVMESLDVGDAVSTITLRNAELLQKMGFGGTILGLHSHPDVAAKLRPAELFNPDAHAALIFHYWNYSNLEDFILGFHGPKAIHFHNITPPEYFPAGSIAYKATSRGYEQLPMIINHFDLLIGDSTYNLEVCRGYLSGPKPAMVIPPVVEPDEVRERPFDVRLLEELRRQEGAKLMFVGRIARNKRQDRLIELFDAYYRTVDRHAWLYLVGSDHGDPAYRAELEARRNRLISKDRIIFTGKVREEALSSYYRGADAFVCASEHEGFCLPILEAMALDVPVLAYAATAVPETMGDSGLLIQKWDAPRISELVHNVLNDSEFRQRIILNQHQNLSRFTVEEVSHRLQAVRNFLVYRQLSPSIYYL